MKIEIENLTEAQAIALEDMLATWQWLGRAGASRWTAFFADGDGNFRPKITVDGRVPQKTKVIETGLPATFNGVVGGSKNYADFWKTIKVKSSGSFDEWRSVYEVYMIDFDDIAWKLRAEAESNGG